MDIEITFRCMGIELHSFNKHKLRNVSQYYDTLNNHDSRVVIICRRRITRQHVIRRLHSQ